MAGSRFAYVRSFELPDPLLPHTFILFRLDGHSFHNFSDAHSFAKPNDQRALQLMDHAARSLMQEYSDILIAFGESDEYSFLFRKAATLYNRRQSKITSTLCSLFTASYVMHWSTYFPDTPLRYPPSFDARIVLYPGTREIRDYFSWRQADTHINNLYNTAFWALIQQGGQSTKEAHETLRGTVSSQKHEILFSRFGINYNTLPSRFRKGSVLVREKLLDGEANTNDILPILETSKANTLEVLTPNHPISETASELPEKQKERRASTRITLLHCDIIGDEFWNQRPYLLEG